MPTQKAPPGQKYLLPVFEFSKLGFDPTDESVRITYTSFVVDLAEYASAVYEEMCSRVCTRNEIYGLSRTQTLTVYSQQFLHHVVQGTTGVGQGEGDGSGLRRETQRAASGFGARCILLESEPFATLARRHLDKRPKFLFSFHQLFSSFTNIVPRQESMFKIPFQRT